MSKRVRLKSCDRCTSSQQCSRLPLWFRWLVRGWLKYSFSSTWDMDWADCQAPRCRVLAKTCSHQRREPSSPAGAPEVEPASYECLGSLARDNYWLSQLHNATSTWINYSHPTHEIFSNGFNISQQPLKKSDCQLNLQRYNKCEMSISPQIRKDRKNKQTHWRRL